MNPDDAGDTDGGGSRDDNRSGLIVVASIAVVVMKLEKVSTHMMLMVPLACC